MRAFLGYRGVAADEPIRFDKQFYFHRRRIPDPGGNEVVQLNPVPLKICQSSTRVETY